MAQNERIDWTNRVLDASRLAANLGRGSVEKPSIRAVAEILGVNWHTAKAHLQQAKSIGIVDRPSTRSIERHLKSQPTAKQIDRIVTKGIERQTKRLDEKAKIKEVSRILNTSPQQAGKVLKKIQEGKPVFESRKAARQAIEKAGKGPIYFDPKGPQAPKITERTGKNWKIESFELKPGTNIERTNPRQKFQAVVYAKQKDGSIRKITTSFANSPQTAYKMAEKQMKKYKKVALSSVVIVRFTPKK